MLRRILEVGSDTVAHSVSGVVQCLHLILIASEMLSRLDYRMISFISLRMCLLTV
jgi:hypothetical protein